MKNYDIDLGKHVATNIRHSKIKNMDVILCITDNQKDAVQKMYPKLKSKIYTVKEFTESEENLASVNNAITNPWGYDMDVYETCANELNSYTTKILNKL